MTYIYPIVNAFRYTIVRSLYWKIKAILADSAQIPSNFRIRMKIPSRRRMHPSIVQVDPTPPGHPAEAREFVRVPATSLRTVPCIARRASRIQQPSSSIRTLPALCRRAATSRLQPDSSRRSSHSEGIVGSAGTVGQVPTGSRRDRRRATVRRPVPLAL